MILVESSTHARTNVFSGADARKPSIDTGVHALLYERLADIDRIVHFHEAGLVIPTATTSFPYPCGTVEEADEMCRALASAAAAGDYVGGPFMLELVNHGYLLGLNADTLTRMRDVWNNTRREYVEHLREVGENVALQSVMSDDGTMRLSPIFNGPNVIGIFAERLNRGYASCYLNLGSRGRGWGEPVMDRLIERGCTIGAHANCAVATWYHRYGWSEIRREDSQGNVLVSGPLSILIPPTKRDDLIAGATACVFNPIERTVLLGKRLTKNWRGQFALPGGRVENENALAAALRELEEETCIQLYDQRPYAVRRFYTGTDDGRMAFGVDCHVFLTVHSPTPKKTEEMDAEWVPLDTAWRRAPMDHATRRMLCDLLDEFPGPED